MSIASTFGKPLAFYGIDRPGGETTTCPDCSMPADGLFGDHGGDCLDMIRTASPTSALGIIRRAALANGHVDANLVRSDMDAAGVPGPSRGPAFAAAVRREWIEVDGYQPSTDAGTKGHPVAVYRSLIYKPRKASA